MAAEERAWPPYGRAEGPGVQGSGGASGLRRRNRLGRGLTREAAGRGAGVAPGGLSRVERKTGLGSGRRARLRGSRDPDPGALV